MLNSKILFQMTGSIACFKACQVLSKLAQARYDVQVVATKSALQFVGTATLEGLTGKAVVTDLFEQGRAMDHIHLVRWADLILVAPATANHINKMALGIGDDLLTTQFLAHDFKKPFLIAPAMNTAMYQHPTTQKSLGLLKNMGVEILETASGVLACGEIGWGRLLEPDLILAEIETRLKNSPSASSTLGEIPKTARAAKKILVTAGGTQQPIDQVRHLGNKSTGVTAAGISEVLYEMGFDVIYLQAKGSLSPRTPCEKYSFVTFEDLQQQLRSLLKDIRVDGVVHAAAVADFSVDTIEIDGKTMALNENIKLPTSDTLQLRLKKNPKLVNELRTLAGNSKLPVVAFKMTSHLPVDQARIAIEKVFSESKSNLVIHNDTREIDWDQKKYVYHVYKSKEKIATCENQTELGFQIGNYLMEVDP